MSNDNHEEPPRYGERIGSTPQPSAPEPSAPEYGQQAPPPQWGSAQQPYGQQQYGQPQQQYGQPQYGQPQYGQPQGSGQWNGAPARKRKTVGVVAFVAGIVALALGVVGGILFGDALSRVPGFMNAAQSGSTSGLEQQVMNDPSLAGPFITGVLLAFAGTVIGLWAIVQGIVAAVTGRGRLFGILAIVAAVVGVVVFVVLYAGIAVAGAS